MELHTLSLTVPRLQRPGCSALSDSAGLLGTSPSLSPSRKLPSPAVNHALAYGTNCPNWGRSLSLRWNCSPGDTERQHQSRDGSAAG